MAKVHKNVKLLWVNSDEAFDIVDKFDVTQVPSLVIVHPHKAQADKIENPSTE